MLSVGLGKVVNLYIRSNTCFMLNFLLIMRLFVVHIMNMMFILGGNEKEIT